MLVHETELAQNKRLFDKREGIWWREEAYNTFAILIGDAYLRGGGLNWVLMVCAGFVLLTGKIFAKNPVEKGLISNKLDLSLL